MTLYLNGDYYAYDMHSACLIQCIFGYYLLKIAMDGNRDVANKTNGSVKADQIFPTIICSECEVSCIALPIKDVYTFPALPIYSPGSIPIRNKLQ